MSRELLYWILILFWLLFGLWVDYVPNQPYPVKRLPWNLLLFALFLLIGWQIFGSPVKP